MIKYSLQYFIDKFRAIPYEQWTHHATFVTSEKKDFLGHLNSYPNRMSEEGLAFIDHTVGFIPDEFGRTIMLYMINDGEAEFKRIGVTPKDRWIRWLEALQRHKDRQSYAEAA